MDKITQPRARCGGDLLEAATTTPNAKSANVNVERERGEKLVVCLGVYVVVTIGRSAVVVVEGVSLVALGLPV
jgi:hypothetical protein